MVSPGAARSPSSALESAGRILRHRYPNGLPSGYPHLFYGRETAERALQHAEQFLEVVAAYYRECGEIAILEEEGEGIEHE